MDTRLKAVGPLKVAKPGHRERKVCNWEVAAVL